MLFDTHCHLDISAFDGDRDAVFARAHDAGVTRFLNPAYDLDSSRRAVALAQARDDVVAAVGVHPNDAAGCDDSTIATLRNIVETRPSTGSGGASLRHPAVVALGEIGLDYYWDTTPRDKQREAFVAQLQLARELNLPVIIHCRDAYDDCLGILREHGQGLSLVLHSFAGKMAHLRTALDLGYTISVGGPLTYPNAHTLRDCVKAAPIERIVLETDAPYLAPQGQRGKRNEPAYLRQVAERLADMKGMSLDDTARITSDNARRLFRLEDGNG